MHKSAQIINVESDRVMAVREAEKIYRAGGIFIYPTDTIYGFGCDPFNIKALRTLNNIKGRDEQKQYILLVDSVSTLLKYIDLNDNQIIALLKNIWPNPVSIIFKLNYQTRNLLKYDVAAFRIPNNSFCLELLSELNAPLVSTSVNISNRKPLTDFQSIKKEFVEKVNTIFFTDQKEYQVASTLVDLTKSPPAILREGKINFMELWQKLC